MMRQWVGHGMPTLCGYLFSTLAYSILDHRRQLWIYWISCFTGLKPRTVGIKLSSTSASFSQTAPEIRYEMCYHYCIKICIQIENGIFSPSTLLINLKLQHVATILFSLIRSCLLVGSCSDKESNGYLQVHEFKGFI